MEIGQKVKIISDSTCDLSQELTAKYDIDILPLHILLGDTYVHGVVAQDGARVVDPMREAVG